MFRHASVLVLAMATSASWSGVSAAEAPASPSDVSEVVVTGSRIVRNGYSAPTPVTVASIATLQQSTPSNIPDALNKLPSFAASKGQGTVTNGSTPGVGNFLNLRGFGVPRTLILLDGRRAPPTSFDGTIDVNTFPQMLVQRVDVVTGGASAIYGSDAVTGVVNFVLDHHFTGLKGVVQGGIASRGDDKSWRAGLAGGADVLDKGHVIWSVEHYQSDGLKAKEDRPYGSLVYGEAGAGSAANPFHLLANTRVSNTSYGGLVQSGPFAGQQFLPGGTLGPFNAGTPTGTTALAVGGDGAYLSNQTLLAKLRTDQAFGRFEYEFTPNITGFAQVNLAEERTVLRFAVEQHSASLLPITIFSGNAFLQPSVQAILTATNTPSFTMARYGIDFPKSETNDLTDVMSATVGFNAKLPKQWSMDAFFTASEGRLRLPTYYNTNAQRFYAALDAVKDPGGNIVCRVSLTSPGLYPGCVPLNLFGQGAPSQAAQNYILGETQFQVVNTTEDAAVNITGDLFSTWAGPISVAFGGEWRAQKLDETTNADPNTLPNFTGLRGGFTSSTQLWRTNIVAASHGSSTVWEVNAETVVPLAKDLPFVRSLEVNGAARYTDYSTSGRVTTWKVGLNYQPFEDLRFRATRSRDIRAPTLFDLYGGRQISPTGFTDNHTNTTGITQMITGGNPNLVAEVAQTTTAGVIYSPSWARSFVISVDWYNIDIANGLAAIGGAGGSSQSECEQSNGASPICALYVRPFPFSNRTAANFPTALLSQNLNVAQTYTHGVDVEASYAADLATLSSSLDGSVDLRALFNYQPVLKTRNFPSAPVVNAAGAAPIAAKRLTLQAAYNRGPFSVNLQTRFLSSMKQSGNPALIFTDPRVKSVSYTDLAFEYKLVAYGHTLRPFLSIENLFDKQPPIYIDPAVASVPGLRYPVPGQTDIAGRYFTGGVRFTF